MGFDAWNDTKIRTEFITENSEGFARGEIEMNCLLETEVISVIEIQPIHVDNNFEALYE